MLHYSILRASLLLIVVLVLQSCNKQSPAAESVTITPISDKKSFVFGADLSYVNQIEDFKGTFQDGNTIQDVFTIFKNRGNNLVRVRLWHNPIWVASLANGKIYSDLSDVEKTIRRAKNAGMAVNLDFHYADEWADPDKQYTPEAWKGLPFIVLQDSVYRYTLRVLRYLEARDLTPEMVQIGNETNNGMLHPVGQIDKNGWKAFGDLTNSGIRAVRDFSKTAKIQPKIIIHVAQLQNADWWINNITTTGGVSDFDVLGLSHYFKWSTVRTMPEITATIKRLKSKINKEVMIVETAYPWTAENKDNYTNVISGQESAVGYPVSASGQLQYMKDLTQAVMDGGGTGIMYWEPAWISSELRDKWGKGSSWENNAFFDFQGNALPVFEYMKATYK